MNRKTCCFVLAASLSIAAFGDAAPVRLARTPDYHAGKIAFSYLGDIWVVTEDGSNPTRITDNAGRDINPRFSPDGQWIAFSSNRFGNYDVFVAPAAGGSARRLTFHTGNDEVLAWTRDSKFVVFRASHGDGAFPNTATLYKVAVGGGPAAPLPVDWGWWGSFSPDGKSLVFNRHPATWSRKHYRGSYAADIWVADLQARTYRQVLAGESYNRYWPMWGPKDEIYFVGDPLPNEKAIKPGTPEVRQSRNNIYKIAASGAGQPVQVTKHTSGNVFFPSMSSDGKVIVYEGDFGLWKLDVATGKATEVKVDITTEEKENQVEYVTVTNEADSFDLSPSGKRAVISTRNQIFTIATDRGDITVLANDKGASRNESPQWSPDGRTIAFVSDRSGRQEVYVVDANGRNLKKITDLDTDKGPILWTPDSKAVLYGSTDKKLYLHSLTDAKTTVVTSSTLAAPRAPSISPDGKWVTFVKQDQTMRGHVYLAPITGGEERHVATDAQAFSETGAAWTADGRYLVFTTSAGTGGGVASTGGRATTQMQLWVLALRAQDKDPLSKDIDSEEQAVAAETAARGSRGGAAGGVQPAPVEVKIEWEGLLTRARRVEVSGEMIGGLTAARSGSVIAFTTMAAPSTGAAPATPTIYTLNVADGSVPARVPAAPPSSAVDGAGRGTGGGRGATAGGMVFSPDGRTLYFRSGRSIYAAPVAGASSAGPAAGTAPTAGGRGGRGATPPPAAGAAETSANATARQVTFTINTEIDRNALRHETFTEGWRVMKTRFYDAHMHGADWNAAKAIYGALLDNLVDQEELHAVMMQMIGELNASHTGVSAGAPRDGERLQPQTRYPGFELEADASGFYRVGHIWKDGPADKDFVRIHEGDFIIAIDDHELKTTEDYWQFLTLAAGRKFHFLLNGKAAKDGAWDVTIEPMSGQAYANAQYSKWVADRGALVEKLGNGEIGYLHIRAMDAPSLRQFTLDLAVNRTKKALIIDQRFNGGGGIDQELLSILVGQKYQYTRGRDAGADVPRPLETFYGPMVVMQNERSASDAEMFPQGFKDLKLGKTIGVPTMGAVIGTGSFTLADGSAIRTPGSGVWTASGANMENFGVKPDIYVDNTPEDLVKGRDAQIEKAVDVLRAEIAAGRKKGL
ncbi:MAG TPA: S41 family peptidase [Vicinamibacterales bacterium]|jgi:tricorn protease